MDCRRLSPCDSPEGASPERCATALPPRSGHVKIYVTWIVLQVPIKGWLNVSCVFLGLNLCYDQRVSCRHGGNNLLTETLKTR